MITIACPACRALHSLEIVPGGPITGAPRLTLDFVGVLSPERSSTLARIADLVRSSPALIRPGTVWLGPEAEHLIRYVLGGTDHADLCQAQEVA